MGAIVVFVATSSSGRLVVLGARRRSLGVLLYSERRLAHGADAAPPCPLVDALAVEDVTARHFYLGKLALETDGAADSLPRASANNLNLTASGHVLVIGLHRRFHETGVRDICRHFDGKCCFVYFVHFTLNPLFHDCVCWQNASFHFCNITIAHFAVGLCIGTANHMRAKHPHLRTERLHI